MQQIRLPWPPTVNSYYRAIVRGRNAVNILSAAARAYKKAAAAELAEQTYDTYRGAVAMTVLLYPPTNQRWDVDNRLKAICDVLQENSVVGDDRQFVEILAKREPKVGKKDAHAIIILTPR